jgi:hypothetical protein
MVFYHFFQEGTSIFLSSNVPSKDLLSELDYSWKKYFFLKQFHENHKEVRILFFFAYHLTLA